MNKRIKAFTLIELLVVIAIVGILSGFAFVSMSSAINNANDAKRKADLASIQKAIAAYAIQNSYPSTDTYPCTVGGGATPCTNLDSAISQYIPNLPTDPSGDYYTYSYADGNYILMTDNMSNNASYYYDSSENSWKSGSPIAGACGSAATSYAIDATVFAGTMCSAGNNVTNPSSPVFPAQGGSTTWTCGGSNGGGDSGTCTASRAAFTDPFINGSFDGTWTGWTAAGGSTKSISDTSSYAGSYTSYINYTFDCALGEIYQNIAVPNASGTINLEFWERTYHGYWSGDAGVLINNSWVWREDYTTRRNQTTSWLKHTINVSAYKGQTIKISIAWNDAGHNGCGAGDHPGWIRVDEMKLVNVQ